MARKLEIFDAIKNIAKEHLAKEKETKLQENIAHKKQQLESDQALLAECSKLYFAVTKKQLPWRRQKNLIFSKKSTEHIPLTSLDKSTQKIP